MADFELKIANSNGTHWRISFYNDEVGGLIVSLGLTEFDEDGAIHDLVGWEGQYDVQRVVRLMKSDTPELDEIHVFTLLSLAEEMHRRVRIIDRAFAKEVAGG